MTNEELLLNEIVKQLMLLDTTIAGIGGGLGAGQGLTENAGNIDLGGLIDGFSYLQLAQDTNFEIGGNNVWINLQQQFEIGRLELFVGDTNTDDQSVMGLAADSFRLENRIAGEPPRASVELSSSGLDLIGRNELNNYSRIQAYTDSLTLTNHNHVSENETSMRLTPGGIESVYKKSFFGSPTASTVLDNSRFFAYAVDELDNTKSSYLRLQPTNVLLQTYDGVTALSEIDMREDGSIFNRASFLEFAGGMVVGSPSGTLNNGILVKIAGVDYILPLYEA